MGKNLKEKIKGKFKQCVILMPSHPVIDSTVTRGKYFILYNRKVHRCKFIRLWGATSDNVKEKGLPSTKILAASIFWSLHFLNFDNSGGILIQNVPVRREPEVMWALHKILPYQSRFVFHTLDFWLGPPHFWASHPPLPFQSSNIWA